MEDRTAHSLDSGPSAHLPHAFFGVFDGHGGHEVAVRLPPPTHPPSPPPDVYLPPSSAQELCAERMHAHIRSSAHFPDLVSAVQDGFLRTDADVLANAAAHPKRKESNAGSAAIAMLVTAHQLVLAHAGDCRGILLKRDGSFVSLTADHAADEDPDEPARVAPDEAERVRRAGGRLDSGYVYVGEGDRHNLPMTRALGNLRLKVADGRDWRRASVGQQVVTALPTVHVRPRSPDDLAVVLASDGLFGSVMPSEAVAELAARQLREHEHTGDAEGKAARALVEAALEEHHGSDNVSVTLVALQPPPLPLPVHVDGVDARHVADGPAPLEHANSQASLLTETFSPGRAHIKEKLGRPFCEAFPPSARPEKENNAADGGGGFFGGRAPPALLQRQHAQQSLSPSTPY